MVQANFAHVLPTLLPAALKDNVIYSYPVINNSHTVAVVDDFFKSSRFPKPPCPVYYVHASEQAKSLRTVESIVRWLLEQEAGRDTLLLGIGGGIVTDLVGLTASIYKRGMPYGLVPTTLLAQVDASIGGKCGVNFDGFKNILGCFAGAEFVYIDPKLTATLPDRQLRCGAAEMIKTFLLADAESYAAAVRCFSRGTPEPDILDTLVRRAVQIKSSIVAEDYQDRGRRHILNLGHTFAHAIEKCSDLYLHGEAVAIGISMACDESVKEGLLQPATAAAIKKDLYSVGLPTECDIPAAQLMKAILQDKKRSGDKQKFILLEDIGKPVIWERSVSA